MFYLCLTNFQARLHLSKENLSHFWSSFYRLDALRVIQEQH